ncbi:MAG: 2-hydroxyacyl-CoA dehydratase [Promethearchaeota archaeon]|nr:MAG: 2-hydroxyacyl-CoA dehydratase [Candidatus Lokiarchaeota archaeon]
MKKIAIFDSGVETPEEIIMAAGFTPYRLFGDPTIQVDKANEHIPPTHCLWTRNLLEQALRGLDQDIEGLIAAHGCDRTNREFDIWYESINVNFKYFLNTPLKRDEIALKFFINDIKELIFQLENTFKVKISDNKITEAILKTNKIRSLLKEISEYRAKNLILGSEFHSLVKKALQLDKDNILPLLTSELEKLNEKSPLNLDNKKRVLLTGSDIDDTEFLTFLEDLGFHIVIDDLCVGTKYFWHTIDEQGDPIKALAKYHLEKPIYSTKFPSYNRFNVLKMLAQTYKVQGIINVAQKFCEPVLYDHPYLNKKFKELKIPYLFVEVTYNRESYKQLSTRFSAFAEMI